MKIILDLETKLAEYLESETELQAVAASNYATLPSKPYIVVKADVSQVAHKSEMQGTVEVWLKYNPQQGLDSNGSGDAIFDKAELIRDAVSDDETCLEAINDIQTYLYRILRFAGGEIVNETDNGRAIIIRGIWAGRKI